MKFDHKVIAQVIKRKDRSNETKDRLPLSDEACSTVVQGQVRDRTLRPPGQTPGQTNMP